MCWQQPAASAMAATVCRAAAGRPCVDHRGPVQCKDGWQSHMQKSAGRYTTAMSPVRWCCLAQPDLYSIIRGVCTVLQAFLDAINAIGRQGTLLVPAGRYLIRKQLHINTRVVLRGEAPCCTGHRLELCIDVMNVNRVERGGRWGLMGCPACGIPAMCWPASWATPGLLAWPGRASRPSCSMPC